MAIEGGKHVIRCDTCQRTAAVPDAFTDSEESARGQVQGENWTRDQYANDLCPACFSLSGSN